MAGEMNLPRHKLSEARATTVNAYRRKMKAPRAANLASGQTSLLLGISIASYGTHGHTYTDLAIWAHISRMILQHG